LNKKKYKSEYLVAFFFLAPAMIGLVLFRIYPIGLSLVKSLFAVNYSQGTSESFAGLKNYIGILKDKYFWESLIVTLKLNLFINPIQIFCAFAIALLISKNSLSNRIFRTLFLIPLGVSVAVASSIWGILLNPNKGLINSILNVFSIGPQAFLRSPDQALWCIIMIASWCGISYWMIFLMAGLQEIPENLYEAARVDGAKSFQQLFYITLPLMKRTLLFVTVADTAANFLLFVPMFVLTKGGPANSTNSLMYEVYASAFVYSDFARSLTLSILLLLVLMAVIILEFKLIKTED